jgi:YVTN family beta-propeller protein
MLKHHLLAMAMLLFTSSPIAAQYLLALSKKDHTLAIIDPATLQIRAKVPVGQDPHEVIASTDGTRAYVSIYGGGSLHELDVIDLVALKALPSMDTKPFYGPHGLYYSGGKLWFTVEGSKCVARYDPATNTFDWVMGTGQERTHMLYVTSDQKKVYTTNVASGTVSILTNAPMQGPGPGGSSFHWTQTLIPVGRGSEGFDITPDGKSLWTVSADDGGIYIIDLDSAKVEEKLDAKVFGANRLQITPDGKWALISSLRNGDLVVYDVTTRKEGHRIHIGTGAAGILVQPDGTRAFIGCTSDNYVAVVDLKTWQVTSHIDVGGGPDGVAWAIRH